MTDDLEKLRHLRRQVEQQLKASQGFGERVRQLRRARQMTLEDLAAASRISKAYLSQIENGHVDPPRDEKIRRLEQAFGERPGALVLLANLARTPEEVRARLRHLQSAFTRTEETLQALLERLPAGHDGAAGEHGPAAPARRSRQPAPEQHPIRGRVPIINRVAAGYPAEFTDMDYPAGVADDYIGAPPGLDDPSAFAVRVAGDSMEPRYREGDIVLFSPAAPVASGDDCYVRFAPECTTAQGATFKRVYFDSDTQARLQPLNDRYPPLVAPLEGVAGIYKAVFRYEAL